MKRLAAVLARLLAFGLPLLLEAASAPLRPTELPGLRYTNHFFPGTTYRSSIPAGETLLGFPFGERAATSLEIERCLKAWTNAAPDRTRLVEYARSHEGRPLHYLVITSPAHLARLETLQDDLARLGDPRRTPPAEASRIIEGLPAPVWLAFTIHGDETEGSDAALALVHHLLAAEDPAVERLLSDLVILIDPLMNPDGRDRFLKMIAEHRGTSPNLDDQSLLHAGYWPWGRGNHYLADLNRDWLVAEHPETRGRLREVARWNPVLFVDAHGMGAQETHLFSPPREPINPNIPASRGRWSAVFARDQARTFDVHGLVYYTGEWAEEWFPGYSDSWASYRGAVGILYEQARIAADGVRRPEGRILSYRESVLHHVLGSMANLKTAQANAKALLADLHAARRAAVDPAGPYGRRTFAVLPTANATRLRDLADLLQRQGFEIFVTDHEIGGLTATNQWGRTLTNATLPRGSILVPNRQPLGHLLAAFLEFDPRLSPAVLEDERRELLRTGHGRIYDTTAWNLTMMYGLTALTLATDLPDGARPYRNPDVEAGLVGSPPNVVAWVVDGADDASLAYAARLMEQGVQVRAAERPFVFDDQPFARGSIVVTRLDNRTFVGDLPDLVARTARDVDLTVRAVASGLGEGDLPDLGGSRFQRLDRPSIATVGRDESQSTEYGSVWHALDHRLGIRHSQLDGLRGAEWERYNVVILPPRQAIDASALGALKDWVRQGGTLIAIGSAAGPLITEKAEFSRVRDLPDVLGRLPDFELAVLREWQARAGAPPDPSRVWSHQSAANLDYPWQVIDGAFPDEKELKRRDAWQSLFMPEGAFLAARIDTNHWLTAGCPEPLPVLSDRGPILMAADVEAPIRLGYLTAGASTNPPPPAVSTNTSTRTDSESAGAQTAREGNKEVKTAERPGWTAHPPGTEMQLRMSGLLWPEASHRLAHSAWVTRESLGRGQIILFASSPTFRSGARGMTRVFLNAVVLGPGWGARAPLRP